MLDDTLKTRTRLIGMVQPREVPGRRKSGCTPSAAPAG
jgi:hypothetical protein